MSIELAVLDTNVIAYMALGIAPYRDEAWSVWGRLGEAIAPAHWQAELTQTLWVAVRRAEFNADSALQRLAWVADLPIRTEPLTGLQAGALRLAMLHGVAVYDTLFVELAAQRGCPLVTYDKQLLRVFPDIACPPAALR
ncbi:MAG TPA: type II toxin-antitoxin system VapC family toxin [Terriglobales bacterium]|nr:type II toxin-antitoxin system VapC family toxin [Terriglobales bacterium]